jgi:hypothetical protein
MVQWARPRPEAGALLAKGKHLRSRYFCPPIALGATTHDATGKKEHDSDQWWTKAFDNQLKSLDVSNSSSGEVTVKQTVTNATPLGMAITSRYYIKFVSGGVLKGDVEPTIEGEKAATEEKKTEEKAVKKEKKEKKEKKKSSKSSSSKSSSSKSSRASSIAEEEKPKEKKEKKKRKAEETKDDRKEKKRLKRLLEKEMASLQALSVEA